MYHAMETNLYMPKSYSLIHWKYLVLYNTISSSISWIKYIESIMLLLSRFNNQLGEKV